MARLIHLNGPPGAGKSTLALRYLDDHPLVLVVDIDHLRTNLGQWAVREHSRLLARDLAVALIECHLAADHDVVVPQFVGRLEFLHRLEATADRLGVPFVEVFLAVEPSVAADRFRERRRELHSSRAHHPERDIHDDRVGAIVDDAVEQLVAVSARCPGATTIAATANLDETYRLLMTALERSD